TQVIQNFIDSRNFAFAISYHSFGNLVLWGPGYVPGYFEDEDIFAGFGAAASANNSYTPGNSASGVIYLVNGDSDDWAYNASTSGKVFGLTPEVGTSSDYFNPPASRIPTLVVEGIDCAYVAIENADRPGRLAPPGQPGINAIPPSGGTHDVTWSAPTTADVVVTAYEITEKTGPAVTSDNLESGSGNWSLDGFSVSTARASSGSSSLYSGSGNDVNHFAYGKEGYVVQPGDALEFEAWYDIEPDYDYAYVILSTDGGRSWTNLAGTGTSAADPNGTNAGNGIAGSSSGWQLHSYDLSAYVGQQVWFGFRYYTDGGFIAEGFYVDDITPVQTWTTSTVLSSTAPGTSYNVSGRADGTYTYSVRGQDGEGDWGYPSANTSVTVTASTDVSVTPAGGFFLGKAVPNPFAGTASIRFGLDRAGEHELAVYDIQGRLVRTLSQGPRDAGVHAVQWNGQDDQGTKVTSGVYFYRLTTRSGAKIERTVVLR
ncbi:MAG: T9SS type A sorting domain-containing protein, partial [Gemmatimonadetes bacterium]|nr:T9SS type A sorting domain-containing protein [Gemmatimonadota bacterium]